MSSPPDIGAQLREAWRAILAAEHARGEDGASAAAQRAYEVALEDFRRAQIEAFTVSLGHVPLLWERLDAHEARLESLERALGARVRRLETRADIADRLLFYDPLSPY